MANMDRLSSLLFLFILCIAFNLPETRTKKEQTRNMKKVRKRRRRKVKKKTVKFILNRNRR